MEAFLFKSRFRLPCSNRNPCVMNSFMFDDHSRSCMKKIWNYANTKQILAMQGSLWSNWHMQCIAQNNYMHVKVCVIINRCRARAADIETSSFHHFQPASLPRKILVNNAIFNITRQSLNAVKSSKRIWAYIYSPNEII